MGSERESMRPFGFRKDGPIMSPNLESAGLRGARFIRAPEMHGKQTYRV
jgi:hypothetical protein